jgi:diguanylate cyclase (GGDEF)-like protein
MTLPRPHRRSPPLRQRPDRWSGMLRGAAVAVVVLGTVGSVLVARAWQSTVDHQRDERLDRSMTSRSATIEATLGDYEKALRAARALWLASGTVSQAEFRIFARSLDRETQYPGLQNISWREVVRDGAAAGYVATARAEGEPGFAIRPPGRRPVYYVTRYSYPSPLRIGQDARAIPGILSSLERARDTGKTVVSGQITLDEDRDLPRAERPVAYELIVPVYDTDSPLDGVSERRKRIRGWASGQFQAGDFLREALESSGLRPTTGVELHDSAGLVASYPPGFRAYGPDVREDESTVAGGVFRLRYAPLPGNPVLTERTFPAPLVLVIGIAASILLGALLWLLAQVGALYREVGRLARTDSLTGVPNRRAWDEELPRELARAARSRQPVCVALLDLDHFKEYNDRHGHQAGDRFLKEAAASWQPAVRKTDLVARYGGEEFAILLPDCGLDSAMEIADRLRTAQPEGTCSLGVAQWDGREDTTALVARADRALYAAKDAGRDRIHADAPAAAGSAAWTPTS